MFQIYLVNALIFCVILLVIALVVGAIYLIMILADVRKMTGEIKNKFLAVASVLDIVAMVIGGLGGAKKKFQSTDSSTFVAFMSGLKKALQVFFKKEGK
jgi:hypothetical protein